MQHRNALPTVLIEHLLFIDICLELETEDDLNIVYKKLMKEWHEYQSSEDL